MGAKRLIRTQLVMFGLLLTSTMVHANGSLALIKQIGDHHDARMVQEGARHEARLNQEEANHLANFKQLGQDNAILGHAGGPALQIGHYNSMDIRQEGIRHAVYASQQGSDNYISVSQYGDGQTASLYQNGDNNWINVTQEGGGSHLVGHQDGNNLGLGLIQYGSDITIHQSGAP